VALGPTKQPLPGFGRDRVGAAAMQHIERGAVADNALAAGQMPMVGPAAAPPGLLPAAATC
jgi:hypothetical protein